jgi:predicted DCC family thiol-disulfide oxidoreductase YuxK
MNLGIGRDVLLLDGECGLCNRLAQFIDKRRTKNADLAYRPIESEDAQKLIKTFPEKQQHADTVYLVRNGKSYIRSAAGIRVLLYMKWYWKILFPFAWIVPWPLRDFVYLIISKNRFKIFGKQNICTFRID